LNVTTALAPVPSGVGLVKVTVSDCEAASGVVLDTCHLDKVIWLPRAGAPEEVTLRRSEDVATETWVQGLAIGEAPRVAVKAMVTAVPPFIATEVVKVSTFAVKVEIVTPVVGVVTAEMAENTPAGNQMVMPVLPRAPASVVTGVKTTEAVTEPRLACSGAGTVNVTAPIWPPRAPAETLALT